MIIWCARCKKYTESIAGKPLIRKEWKGKVKITNYSCGECHTFKKSIVEEVKEDAQE